MLSLTTVSAFCNSMQNHLIKSSATMEYLSRKVPGMPNESRVSDNISSETNAVDNKLIYVHVEVTRWQVAASGSMGNMK